MCKTTQAKSSVFDTWQRALVSMVLAMCVVGAASASTLIHNAWGTNYSVACGPHDSLQLNATRGSADGGLPLTGNTLGLKSDVTYWFPSYPCWESVTWTSNGTGRRAAKLTGIEDNPNPTSLADFYLPVERFVKLRNLTVDNVDLDYDNTLIWFATSGSVSPSPGISLTLNNGSITGVNPPAAFDSTANFTLTATGDSTISNWWTRLRVPSPTNLNITGAGSKLTLYRVGSLRSQYQDTLYFYGPVNTAMIDGGTLKLDQSAMTFGKPNPTPNPYSEMTFQNAATLEITGPDAKLESGLINLRNSRVSLGLGGTKLIVNGGLALDGARVDLANSARVKTPTLDVTGQNIFNLPQESSSTNYSDVSVSTGMVVMQPDSSLTLNGKGSLSSDFELRWSATSAGQQYGQIVINDEASLINDGGFFRINPGALVNINRTSDTVYGTLTVRNGGGIELLGSAGSAHFTNRGYLRAETDSWITVPSGTFTISGGNEGTIDIAQGVLELGNFGTSLGATARLITDNKVNLYDFSKLKLTIDPTAGTNSQLRTSSGLTILNLAELNLALVNDRVLPVGTKFILVDYGNLYGSWAGAVYFNGYRDRSTFLLGMNRYQINYRDTGNAGYAGAVTITVVPSVTPLASMSPTSQSLTGTVGLNFAPSAAVIASNFGGVVTYSINPALPEGLRFDVVTGVISGVPRRALISTVFTIRGVGTTSGDANATVNLSINKGNQTLTWGPVPAPTFAPGGSVLVGASATSGLTPSYSSLTPSVCSIANASVTVLAAGVCTVAADQAGDANYNPAGQVTQTFTIAKASQGVLALSGTPLSINTGQTTALSTSGGSGSGAISFAVTGACTIVGTTLTGNGTGTCSVTASKAADTNYNAIASNPISIQVGAGAQAALILTASPSVLNINGTSVLSAVGGSGTGTLTYAVSSGPCAVVGSTLTANGVGQCQVVATKAADANFGATTSNPVTLTVNLLTPSALVLNASPLSVGFGGNSTLSTSGGISGGQTTYTVTGPCYVSAQTLTGAGVGTCQVTANQAATSVYAAVTSNTLKVEVKSRLTAFSYPAATAIVGQPFTLTPVTAGFSQPSFALLYGNLPAWASIDPATGVISGTPTNPLGTMDFVVSVFENNAYDAALGVITVQTPAPIPTLSEWAMILLVSLMGLLGFLWLRRV